MHKARGWLDVVITHDDWTPTVDILKCDDETRCFIKQKGKLDLEDTLIQVQYFIESKKSMERKWISGQRKEKGNFKDYGKGVDRNNTMKPKEKSNEPKDTRNFQPKGGGMNS